jgi:peptidoglycan lytic transglycosylase
MTPRRRTELLEAHADEVRQPYVVSRRRLLFAVWLTAVALPVLAIDNLPRTDARAASVQAVSADALEVATTAAPALAPQAAPPTSGVTTSTRATPPPTSPPTTAARPPVTAAPKPPATTSTTAAPPTTEAAANTQTGGASWYDYNPGECAHPTIPKGTVVAISRLGTGASVTCVVTDRGPHGAGRIIDLDSGTFAQLADPSEGVIQVRITW